MEDGSTKGITQDNLSVIANFPLIDGFDDKQLVNLAKSFAVKDREVSQEMISMISEIHPYKASYDANIKVICIPDMKYPEKQYEEKTFKILKDLTEVTVYLKSL